MKRLLLGALLLLSISTYAKTTITVTGSISKGTTAELAAYLINPEVGPTEFGALVIDVKSPAPGAMGGTRSAELTLKEKTNSTVIEVTSTIAGADLIKLEDKLNSEKSFKLKSGDTVIKCTKQTQGFGMILNGSSLSCEISITNVL